MSDREFRTVDGRWVTAVTADEMRRVDRIAIEDIGLNLLQMMENAGRALAWHVRDVTGGGGPVLVAAGNGGNGGGGLAGARHLSNRGVPVEVVLDRAPDALTGAAAHQYEILDAMDVPVYDASLEHSELDRFSVCVDALIGYGLRGEVQGTAKQLIERLGKFQGPIVSLDVPSGLDATSGEVLGVALEPTRTVTLALPKTGLESVSGSLFLTDIGIPKAVFDAVIGEYESPFDMTDWIELAQ